MNTGKLSLGVIGNGYVGGAVVSGFRSKGCKVLVFDQRKDRCENYLHEVLDCDFVFACLPTPMTDSYGGPVNLGAIERFFENVIKEER